MTMKYVRIFLFVCLAACAAVLAPRLAGIVAQPALDSPKLRIEWAEFKTLYDAKKAIVVDVRDAASFAGGHIPGARSIPLDEIDARAAGLKKLNQPIVVYCA